MNSKDLRKSLATKPRLINLTGREDFFKAEASRVIIKFFITRATEDFNVSIIEDESPRDIRTCLEELPFASDYRVVFLKKAEGYVHDIPTTTVVVAHDGSIKNPHLEVDCRKLFGRRLTAFVKSAARKAEVEIDKDDVKLLIDSCGNSVYVLEQEIAKLSLLDEVSNKAIRELAAGSVASRLDELFFAVLRNDKEAGLRAYSTLTDFGASDSQLFGFFVYCLKKLYCVTFIDDNEEDIALKKFSAFKGAMAEEHFAEHFANLMKIDSLVKRGSFPFYLYILMMFSRDYSLVDSYVESLGDA